MILRLVAAFLSIVKTLQDSKKVSKFYLNMPDSMFVFSLAHLGKESIHTVKVDRIPFISSLMDFSTLGPGHIIEEGSLVP